MRKCRGESPEALASAKTVPCECTGEYIEQRNEGNYVAGTRISLDSIVLGETGAGTGKDGRASHLRLRFQADADLKYAIVNAVHW